MQFVDFKHVFMINLHSRSIVKYAIRVLNGCTINDSVRKRTSIAASVIHFTTRESITYVRQNVSMNFPQTVTTPSPFCGCGGALLRRPGVIDYK